MEDPVKAPATDRIETVSSLYDEVLDQLKSYSSKADKIENLLIVLTVVTSGALWALAADVAPTAGLIGAVISTIVIGLTIYLPKSAVQKKRKKSLFIYKEIGKFLAEVRGNPHLDNMEFWTKYKVYEGMVRTLPFEADD
ncbi:MAG TPA: hypothetical protein VIX90_17955 [Edaphobacter sp.]